MLPSNQALEVGELKAVAAINFMSKGGAIIGLAEWMKTPAGRYLIDWEAREIGSLVTDVFGFHAVQVGLPQLAGLDANRMPHRWYALDPIRERVGDCSDGAGGLVGPSREAVPVAGVALHCEFDALPFESSSLDLVLLPHTLELARDPHLALSEVERVLVPEGKVVIVGFNPASLWGLRQGGGRLLGRLGFHRSAGLFLPTEGEFIAYSRLRDWLRLLSFEVEAGRFGCYRPALRSEKWLARSAWVDSFGQRWWPVFGAVYLLVAVKRVRGMRLVGLARAQQRANPSPAVAVHRRPDVPSR